MIHRLLAVALLVALFTGSAFANDIDRHGSYTDKSSGTAAEKCKNFGGTDDNRTACTDWCTSYTAANAGASCKCDEGACLVADATAAPIAAAAPAMAH